MDIAKYDVIIGCTIITSGGCNLQHCVRVCVMCGHSSAYMVCLPSGTTQSLLTQMTPLNFSHFYLIHVLNKENFEWQSLDIKSNLPTTPVLVSQLVGGEQSPIELETSDRHPQLQSSNKDGRATDSCFTLIGAHQCGVLTVAIDSG